MTDTTWLLIQLCVGGWTGLPVGPAPVGREHMEGAVHARRVHADALQQIASDARTMGYRRRDKVNWDRRGREGQTLAPVARQSRSAPAFDQA